VTIYLRNKNKGGESEREEGGEGEREREREREGGGGGLNFSRGLNIIPLLSPLLWPAIVWYNKQALG
jgi:hypothetical protein